MQRTFLQAFGAILLLASIAGAAPAKPTLSVSTAMSASQFAPGERGAIAIEITVPDGFHIQSHEPLDKYLIAMVVTPTDNANLTFGPPIYPKPAIENYPDLGKISIYSKQVIVYLPFAVSSTAAGAVKLEGTIRSQMCDDKTCFAPTKTPFTADLMIATTGTASSNLQTPPFANFDPKLLAIPPPTTAASPTTASTTQSASITTPPPSNAAADNGPQSLIGAVALALVVGVIFNVMPCVLPVLPLKAVGFYEAAQHDRGKTISFGIAFAIGMTAIFTLLAGVVVLSKSLFGHQIQWGEQFAHPGFVWPMAAILAFLGVGMLGLFAVRLPTSIYGLNFRHDTLVGNFLWGGLTAVLATPCTAPLFPPLIAYAIAQPPIAGFITMAAVGVGMSLPYLILSAFPQLARKFPRTGPFAELFKQMMGFLLLGSAAWFVGIRLFPDPQQWWLVFAVVVIASVYLIFRTRQILPSARATVIAAMIALLLTAIGLGATLQLTTVPFKWEHFSPEALAEAKSSNQIVLVEFTASWCLNCKYIEQSVYRNPRVQSELTGKHVITMKADLTDYSAAGWPLLNDLGGTGIPFTAIYPPGGKPLTLESIYSADTLLATLDQADAAEVARR